MGVVCHARRWACEWNPSPHAAACNSIRECILGCSAGTFGDVLVQEQEPSSRNTRHQNDHEFAPPQWPSHRSAQRPRIVSARLMLKWAGSTMTSCEQLNGNSCAVSQSVLQIQCYCTVPSPKRFENDSSATSNDSAAMTQGQLTESL